MESIARASAHLQEVRDANRRLLERRRPHAEAYGRRKRAEGFWIPCRLCGNWRHIHQVATPKGVEKAWKQTCKDCARDMRAMAKGLYLKNRQMVTGGVVSYD